MTEKVVDFCLHMWKYWSSGFDTLGNGYLLFPLVTRYIKMTLVNTVWVTDRPVYIYWESVLFPGTITKWDYFSRYSDKYLIIILLTKPHVFRPKRFRKTRLVSLFVWNVAIAALLWTSLLAASWEILSSFLKQDLSGSEARTSLSNWAQIR